MSAPAHPSRLALDRLALGLSDPDASRHAGSCEVCTAHLKAVAVELPIPEWVKGVGERQRPFAIWRPIFATLAMAAVAVIAFVVPTDPDPAVQAKGDAAVQVWLNHQGQVGIWAGAKLHVGDKIRFEISPGGYTHLTIVELEDGKLYRVLHSAPIVDRLSPAWAVDDEGLKEEVAVLLSRGPLSEEQLQRGLGGQGDVWSTRFVFPKELP
jgi:hypothetical protein